MYTCPNCAGNLRFDIGSQHLMCGSCQSKFDPYNIVKEYDALENDDMEVNVFICPQCAGEIYSTDEEIASFCSFCGASTILSSNMQKQVRPSYIIPFKRTKDNCKFEYGQFMKKAIFAPKALKDVSKVDSFRGIYMPYWVYHVSQNGMMQLPADGQPHREGDYMVTDHYILTGDMDTYYKGIAYDASSSFADSISEKIAPFRVKNMQSFTPSILSGFYADTTDLDSETYTPEAKGLAEQLTLDYLKKKHVGNSCTIDDSAVSLSSAFRSKVEEADLAMFPVWFMSYRNGDRVAYATINGQTGKVVADLPVDMKKYLGACIILAIPFVILLNLFFTVTPTTLIGIISLLAIVVSLIYGKEAKQIAKKELNEDKGVIEGRKQKAQRQWRERMKRAGDDFSDMEQEPIRGVPDVIKPIQKPKAAFETVVYVLIILLIAVATIIYAMVDVGADMSDITYGIQSIAQNVFGLTPDAVQYIGIQHVISPIATLITGITYIKNQKSLVKVKAKKVSFGSMFAFIASILLTVVVYINPVDDSYFYIAAVVSLFAMVLSMIDLIRGYNILATRQLPQFNRKGGDDRA